MDILAKNKRYRKKCVQARRERTCAVGGQGSSVIKLAKRAWKADKWAMRLTISIFIIVLLAVSIAAQEAEPTLDNNTAFYEGEELSYIISPPGGFVMKMEEAARDNYSFAFIPEGESYDSATVLIGINIFRIKEDAKARLTLDDIIAEDTAAIREHFGETLDISETDTIYTKNGNMIRTLFFNDTTTFIPNVMMSYLNGGAEILIFDLSIAVDYPRFMAQQVYMECLEKVKILTKGKIEAG